MLTGDGKDVIEYREFDISPPPPPSPPDMEDPPEPEEQEEPPPELQEPPPPLDLAQLESNKFHKNVKKHALKFKF